MEDVTTFASLRIMSLSRVWMLYFMLRYFSLCLNPRMCAKTQTLGASVEHNSHLYMASNSPAHKMSIMTYEGCLNIRMNYSSTVVRLSAISYHEIKLLFFSSESKWFSKRKWSIDKKDGGVAQNSRKIIKTWGIRFWKELYDMLETDAGLSTLRHQRLKQLGSTF